MNWFSCHRYYRDFTMSIGTEHICVNHREFLPSSDSGLYGEEATISRTRGKLDNRGQCKDAIQAVGSSYLAMCVHILQRR